MRHHRSVTVATADQALGLDKVAERAVATVSGFCQDHEAQCVKDAALMTSLVRTTLQKDDADEAIVEDAAEVPLPIPVPRRRVASAELTRLR